MAAAIRSTNARGRIRSPARNFTISRPPPSRRTPARRSFPPYEIREFEGIPVAFIGLTLKGTPNIVSPVGVAGLEFKDEAETVNALVPELKARGVEAIVVLIHEGGFPTGDYNECPGISGTDRRHREEIRPRGRRRDQRPYPSGLCLRDRRTAGHLRRQIRHHRHRDRPQARSRDPRHRQRQGRQQVIVRTGVYARDPEQTALLESYDRVAAPIANRPAGSVTETLSRTPNDAGESALGDIIADAQLAATRAATNGGARGRIHQSGRRPHRYREEGRRRGELCRRVRQPAVPQPAGHADADRKADQGHAGAAMGSIRNGRGSCRSRRASATPGTAPGPMATA